MRRPDGRSASFGKNALGMRKPALERAPGLPREDEWRIPRRRRLGQRLVASISMHTGSATNLPGDSINENGREYPERLVAYDTKPAKCCGAHVICLGEEALIRAHFRSEGWEVTVGLNAGRRRIRISRGVDTVNG